MPDPTEPETPADTLAAQLDQARAEARSLRILLAQCGTDRDDARAWAQAEAHRHWPDYLDTKNPPPWLDREPPPRRHRRYYAWTAQHTDAQVTAEVGEVIRDMTDILYEYDHIGARRKDVYYRLICLDMLLGEIRSLQRLIQAK